MPGINRDEDLRVSLQEKFAQDKNLSGYGLHVDVVQGEAQLSGIVEALTEKEYAAELAFSVPGIRQVSSAISISTDGPINEASMASEVAEELQANKRVRNSDIHFKVGKSTVILLGEESDEQVQREAEQAAAKARGVTKVVNQIKSRPAEPTLEDVFHSQVRNEEDHERPGQ